MMEEDDRVVGVCRCSAVVLLGRCWVDRGSEEHWEMGGRQVSSWANVGYRWAGETAETREGVLRLRVWADRGSDEYWEMRGRKVSSWANVGYRRAAKDCGC